MAAHGRFEVPAMGVLLFARTLLWPLVRIPGLRLRVLRVSVLKSPGPGPVPRLVPGRRFLSVKPSRPVRIDERFQTVFAME